MTPFAEREPLELRCSALPLAFRCPGSVRREGLEVDEGGAPAELGTAAHEGLADVVETGRVAWGRVAELARRHAVDERELGALVALGAELWARVGAELFPRARAELELEYRDPLGAFVLRGHADIIAWIDDRRVRIGDWKTGHKDADHREQLAGYAALAVAVAGPPARVDAEAFALWVRDGDVERHAMRAGDVPRWFDRVRGEIVAWDGRYRVGTHCQYCPRSHECPARKALVRRDVEALVAEGAGDAAAGLERLSGDELVALLARADLARTIGGNVRGAIRELVRRRGDVTGAGKRLTLVADERRSLALLEAWPVLVEAGLDDDDLAEIVEVSLDAAERVVARKAGRGKGAAARRALLAGLEAAGAIRVTTTTKLVVRRAT